MGLRGRGIGDMISGGAVGNIIGGIAGGPAGIIPGTIFGSGTGSNVLGGLGGSLLGGVAGGPLGSGLGALMGSGLIDRGQITDILGEDLTDVLSGDIGALGDIIEGAKGDPAKIERIKLEPGLQKVVDRAREVQLQDLGRLSGLTGADLGALTNTEIARLKLQQELGQIPRLTQLKSKELAATTGIDDAKRRLRERIAQKGLGTSSIGLAQERSLGRERSRLFEDIKAQRTGLAKERELGSKAIDLTRAESLRNRQLADIQRRAGISAGILGAPGAREQIAITGGGQSVLGAMAPLAGAGIGGLLGGGSPGAITAGMGVGQAASPLFS